MNTTVWQEHGDSPLPWEGVGRGHHAAALMEENWPRERNTPGRIWSKGPGLVNRRSIWSDDHSGFLDVEEIIKQLDMKGRLLMLDGLASTQPAFLSWVLGTSCSWVLWLAFPWKVLVPQHIEAGELPRRARLILGLF